MRYEFKYIVPIQLLSELRARIIPFVNYDSFALNSPNNEYSVRSVYLDTPSLAAYSEKILGICDRKKLRIRVYNNFDADTVGFLEIKTKSNRLGGKYRAKINASLVATLLNENSLDALFFNKTNEQLDSEAARKFLFHYKSGNQSPKILVTYDREAFHGRFDPGLRLTFDKNIRYLPYPGYSELYNESQTQLLSKSYFILEIKFNNGFDKWLQKIIEDLGLQLTSFSKYCNCIDDCKIVKPFRFSQRSSDLKTSEISRVAV